MGAKRRFIILAVAALALSFGKARAADCAKPADARERLICIDPALTAADRSLASAYLNALQPLSAEGRRALRAGQRSWLHFIDMVCTIGQAHTAATGETPAQCFARQYELRQVQLDHATLVAAGRVFGRVESFAARPVADRSRFVTTVIAYPQIDRPTTSSERRWNQGMARNAHRSPAPHPSANGYSDSSIDYRIVNASPDLVSMVFSYYWYGHGAAHGISARLPSTWLWQAARELRPGDLFDLAKPWRDALTRLCFDQLSAEKQEKHVDYDATPEMVGKLVMTADRWTIEREGLGLQFQEYEIGPYVLGAPKVIVPWAALQPYLSVRPAFHIPPD